MKHFNDLLLSLDDGKIYLLASLDLSAAFDTIDHRMLPGEADNGVGMNRSVREGKKCEAL